MKKYDVALQQYDALNKIKSTYDYYTNVISILLIITMVGYLVLTMIYGKDLTPDSLKGVALVMVILELLGYLSSKILRSHRIEKFEKQNEDLFLYKKKEILNFIQLKNNGYDKYSVKQDIKTIVQDHKSDDNKLTDQFYTYVMTDSFKKKITEYLSFCEMESYYDVLV